MVEKDAKEKHKEKLLLSMVKKKISDLRTGSIAIVVFIVLALVGSLFAKYMIKKILSVDVVVIVNSIVLGIAGLIIFCVVYIIIRLIGAAVNRFFKEKGF